MFKIKFPKEVGQHYYHIHYLYVLNIFKYLKCDIEFKEGMDIDKTCFLCEINGRTFAFDFSDANTPNPIYTKYKTFKFHLLHENAIDNLLPFPPVSFYDWDRYYQLEKEIQYSPRNLIISNRQVIYGNAIARRTAVRSKLEALKLRSDICYELRTDIIEQEVFWKETNEIRYAVCVPGHHNNMIDRAQLQLMGFGCCTISPYLPEIFPWYRPLNGAYLIVENDYSDLEERVLNNSAMWFELSMQVSIGAKHFFKETCTPEAIGEWITVHL